MSLHVHHVGTCSVLLLAVSHVPFQKDWSYSSALSSFFAHVFLLEMRVKMSNMGNYSSFTLNWFSIILLNCMWSARVIF